jgi:hypothetical protein
VTSDCPGGPRSHGDDAQTGNARRHGSSGTQPLHAPDRFTLSALADRLVFGHAEAFSADDADELARLLPDQRRWHSFLTDWLPGFSGSMKLPGSAIAGFAAGVGEVLIGGQGQFFE